MFGVFYGLYVPQTERQQRSSKELAFRSLATVSDQLDSRLSYYVSALSQAEQLANDAQPKESGNRFAGVFQPQVVENPETRRSNWNQRRQFWDRYIDDQLRGLRRISCPPDASTIAGATGSSLLIRGSGTQYEFVVAGLGCLATSIADVVNPLLSSIPDGSFDEFFLIDAQGDVIFQTRKTGLRVDTFQPVVFSAPLNQQPGEKQEAADNKAGPSELKFEQIRGATHWLQATFQGKPYFAYTAPLSISFLKQDRSPLVLCGLVERERFQAAVRQAPASWLITGFMVLVIIVFSSWPLLRNKAMTPEERIPRNTGLYYILSTAVTILGAFLLCVHLSYIFDRDEIDGQLEVLAEAINSHFTEEVQRTLAVLTASETDPSFERFTAGNSFGQQQNFIDCLSNEADYCRTNLIKKSPEVVKAYPYFDLIFWSDKQSGQHAKWSVRTTLTPPTPLGGRAFYSATLRGDYWRLETGAGGEQRFRVDPVYSPNTGEYLTLISKPTAKNFLNAAHLVTPLISVVQPVLPPHCGFAIVDEGGSVLFHSISAKNQRENFFDQCSDPEEVREAVHSGQLRRFSTRFGGGAYRLSVRPIAVSRDVPWSMIVFYDLSARREQHVGTMLLFLMMATAYFVLVVALSFLGVKLLRKDGQHASTGIWPDREKGHQYLHLGLVLLVFVLGSLWIVLDLPSYASVFAALSLPVFSLILSKKYLSSGGKFVQVALIGAIATLALALPLLWMDSNSYAAGVPAPWGALAAGGLIFLACASLDIDHSPGGENGFAQAYHFSFYTAVCVEILFLFAFIPSLAFYNVSWDIQERIFTQREQVDTLRALERRKERVERYYSEVPFEVQLPDREQFLKTRLDEETLDRYDLSLPVAKFDGPLQRLSTQPLVPFSLVRSFFPFGSTGIEQELQNAEGSRWQWLQGGSALHLRLADASAAAGGKRASAPADIVSTLRDLTPLDFVKHLGAAVFLLVVLTFAWTQVSLRQVLGLDFTLVDRWPEVDLNKGPPPQTRVVLIGDPASGKSEALRKWEDSVYRLDMTQVVNGGLDAVPEIAQATVALDHFEYRIDDSDATAIKLEVIRRLSYGLKKRVLILSTVDPVFYWEDWHGQRAKTAAEERDRIEKNRRAAMELRSFERMRVVAAGDGPKGDLNRLWLTCSPSEKVALYQLAHEKWPNLKNADALRHLWNRRILSHSKRFVFREAAFERFVLNNVSASEQEKLAQRQSASSWAGIKSAILILAFGVVAAIVLVLGEQMWSTIITVAGALTYLFRLASTMRGDGLLAMLSKGSEKA
jgi:hypothetical protein